MIERMDSGHLDHLIETEAYHQIQLRQLTQAIREGRLSAEQVFEWSQAAIDQNPYGAIVGIDPFARGRARRTDRRIKKGYEVGPLAGGVGTGKDTFKNWKIRDGIHAGTQFEGFQPKTTWRLGRAYLIKELEKQGLNIVAATAAANLAFDIKMPAALSNPFDPELAQRASSAGAAIAAMLLGGVHLGSDLAGSGRVPAVRNGAVFGFKFASEPKLIEGHIPPMIPGHEHLFDNGCAALLAPYPDDIRYALESMGQIRETRSQLKKRLILVGDPFGDLTLNENGRIALDETLKMLQDDGFEINKAQNINSLDPNTLIHLAGRTIGCRIATSLKAGPNAMPPNRIWRRFSSGKINEMIEYYEDLALRNSEDEHGVFLEGFLDGLRYSEKAFEETNEARDKLRDTLAGLMKDHDAIIAPLDHTNVPIPRDHNTLQPIGGRDYLGATAGLNAASNLVVLDALAVPTVMKKSPNGCDIPDGVQFIGPREAILDIGELIQKKTGRFPIPEIQ